MAEQPNDASRKSKAEGERFEDDASTAGRALDEAVLDQEEEPSEGEFQPGTHPGHAGRDEKRSDR